MGNLRSSNMQYTTIALLAIAGIAMSAPLGNLEMQNVFETFKADFNKVYDGAAEEAIRFKVFAENVNMIRDFNQNKAASEGYTMGVNQFTDFTHAEYRELLGYNASAKKPNPIAVFDTSNLAGDVDWTTKGAVTPVKNQEQCGSCWAFSTTGAAEGRLFIKNKKLVSLSEQELVDCAGSFGNQGCNGGLMDDGFKYMASKGDEQEASYPYTAKTGTCNTQKQSAADGVNSGVITGAKDVTPRAAPTSWPPFRRDLSQSQSRLISLASSTTPAVSSPAPVAPSSTTVCSLLATALMVARTTGRSRTRGVLPGVMLATSA